jgi:hypothetical protein
MPLLTSPSFCTTTSERVYIVSVRGTPPWVHRTLTIVLGQGFVVFVDGVGSGFGFHLQPVEFDPEFGEEVLVASALHAGHLLGNLADPLISLLDFRDQALDRFKTGHNFGNHGVT